MTYISMIAILIVGIVVQGFDYDNEDDWSAVVKKKSEHKPPSRLFQNVAITGNPQLINGSFKYCFPSSSTSTYLYLYIIYCTTTTTKRPRKILSSLTTTTTTTTRPATTTTTSTVPYSTKELILQAARDVIPEEDQKKFGHSPWRTCMR
jgi:hypothetical protein